MNAITPRLTARDTCIRLPAINYVRGQLIRVTFVAGHIDSVTVSRPDGAAGGVYIEPKSDSTAKCGVSPVTGAINGAPTGGTFTLTFLGQGALQHPAADRHAGLGPVAGR